MISKFLEDLAAHFWQRAGDVEHFPRDLTQAILFSDYHQINFVPLVDLCPNAIRKWLHARGCPVSLETQDAGSMDVYGRTKGDRRSSTTRAWSNRNAAWSCRTNSVISWPTMRLHENEFADDWGLVCWQSWMENRMPPQRNSSGQRSREWSSVPTSISWTGHPGERIRRP